MSRTTFDVLVVEHTRQQEEIRCDLCEERICTTSGYEANEVTIEALFGDVFPEGDFRTRWRLDICPDCFTKKARPKIEEALGVRFAESEVCY